MEPTVLQEDQRCSFNDDGYLVVPGALSGDEIAALTAASDRMIDDFEREEGQHYVQRRPGIVEDPAFHRDYLQISRAQRCRAGARLAPRYRYD